MARKRKSGDDGPSGKEWLDTYADCITLLMTFFVLLYSMSSVDAGKLKELSDAFKATIFKEAASESIIGIANGTNPIINGGGDYENGTDSLGNINILQEDTNSGKENGNSKLETDEYDEYIKALEGLYDKVNTFIIENGLEQVVETVKDEKGVALQLSDNVLFASASAKLTDDSYYILDKCNNLLKDLPNKILIEGHTDSRPINTELYPSNWELSTARAVNVLKYFVEVKNLSPDRFSAAGYGEFKPVAPNDTYENMARNRRVSILILNMEGENNG